MGAGEDREHGERNGRKEIRIKEEISKEREQEEN